MKNNWEVKKLGEVGKIYNGNSINEQIKKDKYEGVDEGLPFIATKDVSYENIIDYNNGVKIPFKEKEQFKIASKNTVLICAEGGSAGRKIGFTNQDICFGNKLFAITTNKDTESRYVFYYYFSSLFQKQFSLSLAGLIGGVSMNKFKEIDIPVPQLATQKQIVSILDKSFEKIAKAKENAEKNLENTKEIFDSHLQSVFENKGEGWEEKLFEDCLEKINYTNKIQRKDFLEVGNYPIISQEQEDINGYWDNPLDLFKIKKPVVIFGDHTQIIKYIDFNFVLGADGVKILQPIKEIGSRFFYYFMKSVKIKSLGYARHYRLLKEISVSFPKSLSEQQSIVSKLDSLSVEIKRLEAIYQQKLNDLEELKKSILQKAFNGELIKE